MATTITEKFYVKTNGKYDKETIILEEDYPIDTEIADAENNRYNLAARSTEWLDKKSDLVAKKAAATTKH